MTSRSWSYTLNNPDDSDIEQFKSFICSSHRCALEIGDEGTPHLQGCISFKKVYRLVGLKKLNPKVHWEITKSVDHSMNYCTKGEILIDEKGSQGQRNDLKKAVDELISGKNIEEVAMDNPMAYIKSFRGLEKLNYIMKKKQMCYEPCEVTVLWGPTRSGKSRKAFEIDHLLYSVPKSNGNNLWFDGYNGEKTILFDDFYGNIDYGLMLNICDGHPMQVNFKGGMTVKNWNHVIFTSNKPPDQWWPFEEDCLAFLARVTLLSHVTL